MDAISSVGDFHAKPWIGRSREELASTVSPVARSRTRRTQRSDSKPGRAWLMYASFLPSGENAGEASAAGLDSVRFFASPPAAGTSQTSELVDQAWSLSGSAVKASEVPSADQA